MLQQTIHPSAAEQITSTKESSFTPLPDSRNFTTRLIRIWDEVQRFKQLGVIKTDDDRYFIAYRTAENELREVCEEMEILRTKLEEIKINRTLRM
jgi:hypothetical protein